MATTKQQLGDVGEKLVAKRCACPKCKRQKTLKRLPNNFKFADLICDFCGYLAQVKTATVSSVDVLPSKILGAAWGPQQERMDAGIYFPLFIVLVSKGGRAKAVYYLSADLQIPHMFRPRTALSENAKRAGWQGFIYDMDAVRDAVVRLT